jgi:AAA domain
MSWKRTPGVPVSVVPECDTEEVKRALRIFACPGFGFHLTAAPHFSQSVFDGADLAGMVAKVESLSSGESVYFGLNPVPLGITDKIKDEHVLSRRWLLIDVDRIKVECPKDPATDQERDLTRAVAISIRQRLTENGWPLPVVSDSGNGTHLLYRLKEPNDDATATVIKAFLLALNSAYGTVDVDKKVFDARRICKLPGTWNRKGAASAERPWRQAKFLFLPDTEAVPVSCELVDWTTDQIGRVEKKNAKQGTIAPPRPRPEGWKRNTGDRAYGRAALDGEVANVMMATPGHRNSAVNDAYFAMGQLAAGGEILEQEALSRLDFACLQNGIAEEESRKTSSTARRAFAAGKLKRRSAPEKGNGHVEAAKQAEAIPEEATFTLSMNGEVLQSGKQKDMRVKPVILHEHYEIFTLDKILAMDLPAPKWAVEGLLAEGLNLLAGKVKQGKSFLALNLAITVAAGGMALGSMPTVAGDVLYLSLEDTVRRVKERAQRMKAIMGEGATRLSVVTRWARMDKGGMVMLERWANKVSAPRLVIIDVLGKFRAPSRDKGNQYEQDSQALYEIKDFLDIGGITGLVNTHRRKGKAGEDSPEFDTDEITGTTGVPGACDGVIMLSRARGSNDAVISVTGRDDAEKQLAIHFDPPTFTWTFLGAAEDIVAGKLQKAIISYLQLLNGTPAHTKDISDHLESSVDSVRKALHRLFERGLVRHHGQAWAYPGENQQPEQSSIDVSAF